MRIPLQFTVASGVLIAASIPHATSLIDRAAEGGVFSDVAQAPQRRVGLALFLIHDLRVAKEDVRIDETAAVFD